MQPVARTFIALGSINAALAVILGAFGAHALKARISPEMFMSSAAWLNAHWISIQITQTAQYTS